MDFREACRRLNDAGIETMVSMRKDSPVELLFFDEGIRGWNSFCLINDDETIESDAAEDILEIYS